MVPVAIGTIFRTQFDISVMDFMRQKKKKTYIIAAISLFMACKI
jgi:hypothetical protein